MSELRQKYPLELLLIIAKIPRYCEAETDGNNNPADKAEYSAWDVIASGNVGPLGLTAIYTQYEKEDSTGAKTIDNDTLRIIASLKF